MKNILMSCPWDFPIGGVVHVFNNLLKEFKKRGVNVCLLYPASYRKIKLTKKFDSFGEEAFYFPLRSINEKTILFSTLAFLIYIPFVFVNLISLIKKKEIDIVNCHYLGVYIIYFVLVKKITKVKLIISVHGSDIFGYKKQNFLKKLLLKTNMHYADKIVACSNYLAEETKKAFPEVSSKISFVHNGLSLSNFKTNEQPCGIDSPFILAICHQREHKGTDILLKAFEIVQRKFNDLSLVIIGGGHLLEKNKEIALALGINKKVKFLGALKRDKIESFLLNCSLFVHPTKTESFGMVLLEASYHKKGIVTTNVGGIPEILTDNENAFLVKPEDYNEMAKKIITLFKNPGLSKKFGENAYLSLIKNFSLEKQVRDYLSIFNDFECVK